MRRTIAILMTAIMTMFAVQGLAVAEEETSMIASKEDYFFNVLELSPTKSDFVLKDSDFDKDEAKLYQYTIREYNAIREDLIGKYDIIYLGNGTSSSAEYYTLGDPVDKLPAGDIANGSLIPNYDPDMKVYEYWPGNDATELVLGYIEDFSDAGQIVVTDSVFKTLSASESRVHKFVQDNESDLMVLSRSDVKKTIQGLIDADAYSAAGTLRPYLNITDKPMEFDGSEDTYIDSSSSVKLDFDLEIMSYTDESLFTIQFFLDIDGDNKYYESDGELLKERTGVAATDDTSISIIIPEDFKGLQPYMLKIIDEKTGASTYEEGYLGFRGDEPIRLNVLQVACNGNTFDLSTDFVDNKKDSLLTAFSEDYIIDVDVITMIEYHELYKDDTFKLTEYTNAEGKNYNVIIFGFADKYGKADIKDEDMANDLKDFINTGQSVMFTHDNLTFRVDEDGWSSGFTKYFRDFVSQDIYWRGDYPKSGYKTLGFSDMAFEMADGDGFKVSNNVYAFNDGIMTNYPFSLVKGGVGELYDMTYGSRLLDVAKTHYQYYQLDLNNEDVVVWYTLADANDRIDHQDPANFYYTYSIGNVTYSGTGHTDLDKANAFDERKLFVNTIIKAARGANFAPIVTIEGVTDGQRVAKSTKTMNITIIADDPDIDDQYMGGTVYIDKNGDGVFADDEIVDSFDIDDPDDALQNGVPKEVEIDLTGLEDDIDEFSIKVVAEDKGGASGSQKNTFPLVDSPSFEVPLTGLGNILVGDEVTVTISAELTVPDKSIETLIENIELKTYIVRTGYESDVYPLSGAEDFDVNDYESYYSVSGNMLTDTMDDISNPATGLSSELMEQWQFDITAEDENDEAQSYTVKSVLSYDLETYAFSETKTNSRTFDIRRGVLDYKLYDDLGGTVNEEIETALYYYDSASTLALADYVIDAPVLVTDVSGGAKTVGEDKGIDLKTGYYVLRTISTDGYGEAYSDPVFIDFNSPRAEVEVRIPVQPISGFIWIHENTPGVMDLAMGLSQGEVGISEIRFDTFMDLKSFEFGYDDSDAVSEMTMTVDMTAGSGTVIHTDDLGNTSDVTNDFQHDASSNSFRWIGSADMPVGNYVIRIEHSFLSSDDTQYASYHLEPNITVQIEAQDNSIVERVFSFPSVETEPYWLKYLNIGLL